MARKKPLEYANCAFCRQKFVKHRLWARFCPGTSCSDKYRRRKKTAHPIPAASMPGDCEAAPTIENASHSPCSQVVFDGDASRTRSEESDDYGQVVARLNATLRVIRSKCNIQWIAQGKNRP